MSDTNMSKELQDLLAWFDAYEITFNEIRLNEYQYIFNLKLFIESHLVAIRTHWFNPTFATEIKNMIKLKKVLEEHDNKNH